MEGYDADDRGNQRLSSQSGADLSQLAPQVLTGTAQCRCDIRSPTHQDQQGTHQAKQDDDRQAKGADKSENLEGEKPDPEKETNDDRNPDAERPILELLGYQD